MMSESHCPFDYDAEMSDVKKLLQVKLLESLNKCQASFGTKENTYITERNCEVAYLLSAFESVLLHGLRKQRVNIPVLREVSEWMSKLTFDIGLNVESEDGLWEFLKKALDEEQLTRLEELQTVTTNIGRVRSWLRSCFNDSCLEGQFHLILRQQDLLRDHYERWAFLRDVEMVATLPQITRGVDAMCFYLATDSDSLNLSLINEFREIACFTSFSDSSKTPNPLIVVGDRPPKESRPVRRKPLVSLVSLDSCEKFENGEEPTVTSTEESYSGENASLKALDSDCVSQCEIVSSSSEDVVFESSVKRLSPRPECCQTPSTSKLDNLLDSIAQVKADLSALKTSVTKHNTANQYETKKCSSYVRMLCQLLENHDSLKNTSLAISEDQVPESAHVKKITQLTTMHGEVLEMNAMLLNQLSRKNALISRLKHELGRKIPDEPDSGKGLINDSQLSSSSWKKLSQPETTVLIPTAFLTGKGRRLHHVYQVYFRIGKSEFILYRRYSEFCKLHEDLCRVDAGVRSIVMPPKKTWGHKDVQFVELRKGLLEAYLNEIVHYVVEHFPEFTSVCLSRTSLSKFSSFFD